LFVFDVTKSCAAKNSLIIMLNSFKLKLST
jgi:hypothetical protein